MHPEFTKNSGASTSKVQKLFSSCCTSLVLCSRTYHKLDEINLKLQDLEKDKKNLGLMVKNGRLAVKDDSSKDKNRKSQTSLVDASGIVGRQGDKKALIHKLLGDEQCNENFSIVPIVGMGGVGKTTLARLLYNDEEVKDHFKLKAWVCVSDEWDSFNISSIIFQSVTGKTREFKDLNLLQIALRDQLRDKLFLLVLDDVWSERIDDWESLVAPFKACARGSKIIMTTRKEHLLRELGCGEVRQLQSLSHDNAMCLFAHHALGANNFNSHPRLKAYGEGIVRKCDGLPLALIALGRLMMKKKDEVEWKEMLESDIWRLQDVGGVVPALRLSYHELPAYLKKLFAYCSLFPKDYLFDKEDLVLLWMAEGFLHQVPSSKSTKEGVGHECFDELLSRSFFQNSSNNESVFVMHDLMNDLATFVAGDFFFRLEKETEKNVTKQAIDKCRHMSFVYEQYEASKKFEVFKRAKGSRTFLSVGVKERWQRHFLSSTVLVDLLPQLPLLRVISLAGYAISEVPESIGSLKHLRYLNLSQTEIKCLPQNVCNLYNLETLIVFRCYRLAKLPNNFFNLKNLRHLDIGDTPCLRDMPLGIGELKSLQTLPKMVIGGENNISITQLKDLKDLQGKISIEGLSNVQNAVEACEAKLSEKRLTEFEVDWSYVGCRNETTEKEVLDALKPYNNGLKKLGIVNYLGLEFPKWVGDPSFCHLVHVCLRMCIKCTYLPPLGQLASLKELYIEHLDNVKVVGSNFFGTGLAFPSLEILSFDGMWGWELWSTSSGSGDRNAVFPCLQELSLTSCPNLVEVSLEALPSLRVLTIRECGNGVLRSVVHAAPAITKLTLQSIQGLTNEVWGGVILDLEAVTELIVRECDEIRYLWESPETGKFLVNLRKLEVHSCMNFVSLREKDEADYTDGNDMLTSLRFLKVYSCRSFIHCCCPDNIETLAISSCDLITSITFFSMGGGQKLDSVFIDDCKKLSVKEELGGEKSRGQLINNKGLPMLEFVSIYRYPNLASIKFGNFIHLISLTIYDCQSIEESSVPDLQLRSLASLTYLAIINCPSMDAPGLWPPHLRVLEIGRLKKPISVWGPQNFPTSLVDLTLWGTKENEEATSSSELSHLHLPSSLTSLYISDFKKLETVSTALQHLTSLQHLSIRECPKMKELPEMLLPSLLSLTTSGCPNLKERCGKRGSYYWPLISHIPKTEIDVNFTEEWLGLIRNRVP